MDIWPPWWARPFTLICMIGIYLNKTQYSKKKHTHLLLFFRSYAYIFLLNIRTLRTIQSSGSDSYFQSGLLCYIFSASTRASSSTPRFSSWTDRFRCIRLQWCRYYSRGQRPGRPTNDCTKSDTPISWRRYPRLFFDGPYPRKRGQAPSFSITRTIQKWQWWWRDIDIDTDTDTDTVQPTRLRSSRRTLV